MFLQICQWKSLDCNLSPELWGWKKGDAGFSPTMTDSPPAPDDLLKIIQCNCLTNCQNARCSCIKHGLKCSAACGNCHGSACSNASGNVWTKEAVMKIPKQTSTKMRKAIKWKPVLSPYGNFSLNTMASQRTYSSTNNQPIMTLALMIFLFILSPTKI